MGDIKQTIRIEQITDVRQVLKGIDEIQNHLGKLAIGPETKASFDRFFANINKQAEKANEAMNSGFKNKRDVDNYTHAMDQIISNYSKIIEKVEVLKTKGTPLAGKVEDFKQAGEQIRNLGKELKKLKTEFADLQKEAAMGTLTATSNQKFQPKEWGKIRQNFTATKVNIEEVNKALTALNKKYDEATTRGWTKGGNAEEWANFKAGIVGVQTNLEKYTNAVGELESKDKQLVGAQATFNNLLNEGNTVLTAAGNAAATDAENISKVARETGKAARESQQLNSELEHFKSKAAYFFGIANGINLLKRAIRSAYDTVKDLDAVMTETAVVTDFDVGDMWAQLPEYTQRANELGVSIHSAYEAATIFYQQGLKTNEVMAVSNETLKMARIAGLDAATASDRMTNALRGFNMEMDKVSAQRVNDVYSKLAAITASNTDEISTAMTKVASLAHNANMEFETTAAFLAQIIESTRESAETAGTALKTVVARFSEVKKLYSKGELLGTDEEGEEIDVNRVSTALRSAGINLNEYLTGAKGLDDIFMELAEKWDSLDIVQQRYIATMAAGSRQQSRFIALMSDYKRTVELVDAANNANGASQEQYNKTLDSLETKLARLKNAWNEFVLGLANSDAIKGAVDLLTNLITAINKLINLISGKNSGAKMITSFFTAFAGFKIGQKVIGKSGALTSFFGKLVGDNEVVAKGSATKIANAFYANLATKISDFEKGGRLKGNLSSFFNKQINGINSYFAAPMTPALRRNLFQDVLGAQTNHILNPEQNKALQEVLKNDSVAAAEFNKVMEEQKIDFRLTEQNAAKYGFTMQKNNGVIGDSAANMRILATASLAVGAAFMTIGTQLEKTEKFKTFGTVIKGLGAGLLTFGTIMSVYIPLQANLMAQGVSKAIYSIPIVGWIAAAISALLALGSILYTIGKNNAMSTKLEEAAADTKAATEAANEAKEAYEKLGEAWNNLSGKYDTIENATKGTREWRDAIREVNDAVLDLADTYDNVKVKRDENGILRIENQEEIDSQTKRNYLDSASNARISRINELKLKQEESLLNITGAAYEPLIKKLLDEGKLADVADATNEEIEALLAETFNQYGTNWLNPSDYVKSVRDYARDYRENQGYISSQNAVLGANILDKANIDKGLEKYANSLISDKYLEKAIKDSEKKVEEKEKSIEDQYAEARGYDNFKAFKDKNPEEAKKLTDKQIKEYVVSDQLLEDASKQVISFTNNLNNLSDTEKALFAEQNGNALTKDQLSELSAKGYDKNALYKAFGGNAVYGEGGFATFEKWFDDSLKDALDNFDTSKFSSEFVNRLNTDLTGNLTSGTYKSFVDNLWSIYSTSGAEGMKEAQDLIASLAEDVEPDRLNDFIKSINGVDWSSADSIRTLDNLSEEFGISKEAVKNLEEQIIKLNNAAKSIDLEKISTALGLAKKIGTGAQGRSFSEEDYKTAIANGANEKDFIYNVETGNYDYIGQNIQDVRTAIIDQTKILSGQLEKENASNLAVGETIEKYGQPDSEKVGDMRLFLSRYIDAAGENSLLSREVLGGNDEQIRQAYNKVMTAYYNREDTKEKLGQVNESSYQLYTASQNASIIQDSGDESARKALVEQIMSSGLPEEIAQRLSKGVMNPTQADNTVAEAGNLVDILDQAKSFGISIEDLNTYVNALRQIEGLENAHIDTLYALAAANARYQDGFKKVIESYDDWIALKKEDGSIAPPEDGNIEQIKIYEQLKKDLKEMFNLSEDVSDEFLKSSKNVDLMEKAVKGDTKAVSQLRNNLAKANIGVNIKSEDKNKIEQQIDQMTNEATTLEFGATLDDAPFAQGLKTLLEKAGMSVADMQKIFESLGWAPEVTYETVDVADIQKTKTSGYQEIADPSNPGKTITVPVNGISEYAVDGKVRIPKFGNATFVKPSMPSTNSNKNKKAGGGGGSKKKATYWENPYDELYNLQQKINEALRTREALERRYQKLLKQEQATLADIRKSYYAQITNLRGEADLQKQFAAGRLRQIKELGNKIYTDDEGNRKTFSSLGVTKYASYNSETGLITIDWEGLDAISKSSSRVNEGKAAEAYISKLEELVKSYEDVRDKLWDIEDEIESLREAAIESYLSFEDRVMEALVNKYQQEIDSYQSMSDAIDKANSEVIDSLREQVDLSRQIRDNTEKEKEISDMENRLAYLQRDTSGANALEVQKLQKEIEDAREGYTDELVDQAIDKMQNDANLAAEQRARQIETMQEQLEIMKDTGALWQQVYDLIDEAAAGDGALSSYSNLVELLKGTEAFASLSNIGQAKWWSEVAEEFHSAWVGRGEAEDKYKTDANNDGTIYNSNTSKAIEEVTQPAATTTTTAQPAQTTTTTKSGYTDKQKYGVALAICEGYWGNGDTRVKNLKAKGFNPSEIQSIVNKVYKDAMSGAWYGKYYGIKDLSAYKMSKFKQGGLADFTGPAWLDGTKTRPEIVLNAKDSANFIALRDILSSLLNNSGANGGAIGGTKQINVDVQANISSDYDVDRLVNRVKEDIYNDGSYRTNNSINFLR